MDASTAPYKHVLDVYLKSEWALERGVLFSTVPTQDILGTLPNLVGFDYWRSVVRAFRGLGTRPMNIRKDTSLTRDALGAEPTFHNLREPLPVINRVSYPIIWMTDRVPESREREMGRGLMVPNIGECFDVRRNRWFNNHQMGVFIDRANCTSRRLKRELLEEWGEPRSWSMLRVGAPGPVCGRSGVP